MLENLRNLFRCIPRPRYENGVTGNEVSRPSEPSARPMEFSVGNSGDNQIKEITHMIYRINRIVLAYKKDKHYQPTDEMLRELNRIAEACWITYCVVEYVERCLHQRKSKNLKR